MNSHCHTPSNQTFVVYSALTKFRTKFVRNSDLASRRLTLTGLNPRPNVRRRSQFKRLRIFSMISRRSAMYSSIIRNASSEREGRGSGASLLGWSVRFMSLMVG